MKDSRNAQMLRMNVFIALLVSICCGVIAKILSSASSTIYIPASKHVVKEPKIFDQSKTVLTKNIGDELPTAQYIAKYKAIGAKAVIIDFPGKENATDQWKMNVSNFMSTLKLYGFKYAFNIVNTAARGPHAIDEDLEFIHQHYISDLYFRYENEPFVIFDLSKSTGSIRGVIRNFSAKNEHFFPCAIIDDRDLVKSGYEDGLECFMASTVSDSYSWSANPTSWDSIKSTCQSRASIFIPSVQNVFKAAEYRRHERDSPEDYPDEPEEFAEPEPEPIGEETSEEAQRRRDRELRRRRHSKPKDTRSDFHYAWDYAVKASNIIVIQPQNNTNWILSDKDNFAETVENLTTHWLNE